MKKVPKNYNLMYAEIVLSELIKNDITDYVISPGLRNAPLLIMLKEFSMGFKNSDAGHTDKSSPKALNIHIAMDERAAGYMALGIFKAKNKPAALICTSGTALANYYPAILEAHKSACALIVLTADRPLELHYQSANQTLNQIDFFKEFKDPTLNIPIQNRDIDLTTFVPVLHRYISNALCRSSVHINFPFKEPLDSSPEDISKKHITEFQHILALEQPQVLEQSYLTLPIDTEDFFQKNGLLVIGEINGKEENFDHLIQFISHCPWPKIIDISTSIKYNFSIQDYHYPTFDHPEVFNIFKNHQPEVILHLGGKLTSKKYHVYLNQYPIPLIHVSEKGGPPCSFSRVYKSYPLHPCEFAKHFIEQECHISVKDTGYLEQTRSKITSFIEKKIDCIENADLVFPRISKFLIEKLQAGSDLYLGNSTSIRSFDSYASLDFKKCLNIMTHRGVSGIEGFIAASVGYHKAKETKTPTVLVIGDIALIHDLNSLTLVKEIEGTYILLVINNYGGGIFSLVPFQDENNISDWMSTPHEYNFELVCKTFNLPYQRIFQMEDFKQSFLKAQKTTGIHVLELMVDNEKNLEIYQQLNTLKL